MKNRINRNRNSSEKKDSPQKRSLGFSIIYSVFFWCAVALFMVVINGNISNVFRHTPAGMSADESLLSVSADGNVLSANPDSDAQGNSGVSASGDNSALQKEVKMIALTFDDGPHPVYTKMLLDGLLERGVKATFFVVGKNIPGNEDLIARMEEEGHLIGNHTYDHVKICDLKQEDACYQVEQTSALVREITGHDTEFVRPPFGIWNSDLECSFVMIPVLWNVDPLDWTTSNTSLVVQRVIKETEDQDIILLHDFYKSSVEAALQIVDKLKEKGYEFVTVDKLILE